MTRHNPLPAEAAERRKLARRYRKLGYDVQESPEPELLPDFMRGTEPDLVARSEADNVVVEIKRHNALKGSNDLVGIAQAVTGQPDWRLELVVLRDETGAEPLPLLERRKLHEKVTRLLKLDMASVAIFYVESCLLLVIARLARQHGIQSSSLSAAAALGRLGFKGVVPGDMVRRAAESLARRTSLLHATDEAGEPTKADIDELLALIDDFAAMG